MASHMRTIMRLSLVARQLHLGDRHRRVCREAQRARHPPPAHHLRARARRPSRRCRCTAPDAARAASRRPRRTAPARARAAASWPRRRRRARGARTPFSAHASSALRVSTSTTASWNDAATSATGTGSPAASRASTQRATAVFRPLKEKSKRCRSRSRPRGEPAREVDGDRAVLPPRGRCAGRRGTAGRAPARPCRTPRPRRRRSSRRAVARRWSRRARAAATSGRRRPAAPSSARAAGRAAAGRRRRAPRGG